MDDSMSNISLQPKFIADDMVGKLARFLRMLGYDTAYYKDISDTKIIDIALSENRIILTRDTQLVERVMVKDYILIRSDNAEFQLKQVLNLRRLIPNPALFLSRCLDCNRPLEDISKGGVEDRVWPYVFENHERFKICPECERIYWEGDHVRAMRARFKKWGVIEPI
jgi:uncharacterized protein with PIN domain